MESVSPSAPDDHQDQHDLPQLQQLQRDHQPDSQPFSDHPSDSKTTKKRRRRKHRARRRKRRPSFLVPEGTDDVGDDEDDENTYGPHYRAADYLSHRPAPVPDRSLRLGLDPVQTGGAPRPFYHDRVLSHTSLESEVLLDHRDQPMMHPRRESRLATSLRPEFYARPSCQATTEGRSVREAHAADPGQRRVSLDDGGDDGRPWENNHEDSGRVRGEDDNEEDETDDTTDDRTPLIPSLSNSQPVGVLGYGTDSRTFSHHSNLQQLPPVDLTLSTRTVPYRPASTLTPVNQERDRDYDINNPPSIPGSPQSGAADMNYDDAMVTGVDFGPAPLSPTIRRRESVAVRTNDAVIEVDGRAPPGTATQSSRTSLSAPSPLSRSSPPGPPLPGSVPRRRTIITRPAEGDVCFPADLAEGYGLRVSLGDEEPGERRRRRRQAWPDLSVLDDWSRVEKEERSGEFRAKKISEPVLVDGRLRPQYAAWRYQEEEAPYRFTYFNEDFPSTIHAQTISELVQPGGSFRELLIPDPPELEDSSTEGEDDEEPEDAEEEEADDGEDLILFQDDHPGNHRGTDRNNNHPYENMHPPQVHHGSESSDTRFGKSPPPGRPARNESGIFSVDLKSKTDSPPHRRSQWVKKEKPKRYGPRPTWWLDVLCPTDAEMRVIAKAFGIHALTAEDIMVQEAREKVELFHKYYFLNYRTFEQDSNSDNYLRPVNVYVVVFREGVVTFHFSQTPHPANVRRRVRQLRDYLILSSDWISYALIDDITDVFGPLIQSIENEVDDIDDTIMRMHTADPGKDASDEVASQARAGELLRRVGDCRRKVMGLFRLLSNKADVIKGFAKRCNEQWEVAPKSEIGLYLGDIQDHIMTMTSNLAHYETILSRAHSNYLAQINILMNERQERTADVLGKLTVLGTIVLPMNIICGMWGMNVKVPGQDIDSPFWFYSITAGLVLFGVACFYVAKRVYRIV